jgi:hypothetical protein
MPVAARPSPLGHEVIAVPTMRRNGPCQLIPPVRRTRLGKPRDRVSRRGFRVFVQVMIRRGDVQPVDQGGVSQLPGQRPPVIRGP